MKGVYTLGVEVVGEVEVGSLGKVPFDGRYLYVGSARGPGGLKRVARHLSKDRATRWHVDHILDEGEVISVVVTATEEDLECRLSELVGMRLPMAVEGFGCSDCDCSTHLYGPGDAAASALDAHGELERHPQ